MYIFNILLTIFFSIINVIGSILTGKIPKGSMWQIYCGNTDFMTEDYWNDEEIAYRWKSSNENLTQLNNFKLEEDIENVVGKFDEL